jgi:hypothetical protein
MDKSIFVLKPDATGLLAEIDREAWPGNQAGKARHHHKNTGLSLEDQNIWR